jgi:hypothetical protein
MIENRKLPKKGTSGTLRGGSTVGTYTLPMLAKIIHLLNLHAFLF